MSFVAQLIPKLATSDRRSVVFVRSDDRKQLNAAAWFATIDNPFYEPKRTRRDVRERFDYWIGGGAPYNKYFHGWDNPKYRRCFCFKWTERNVMNRFYGFLCHPQPETRPRFELCALLSHDVKHTHATEESHLRMAADLCVESRVMAALQMYFPDKVELKQ